MPSVPLWFNPSSPLQAVFIQPSRFALTAPDDNDGWGRLLPTSWRDIRVLVAVVVTAVSNRDRPNFRAALRWW